VCVPSEDDDGNAASGKDKAITPLQVNALREAINGNKALATQVLEFFEIARFSDLDAKNFKGCLKMIQDNKGE
jgi:hypothetical protein